MFRFPLPKPAVAAATARKPRGKAAAQKSVPQRRKRDICDIFVLVSKPVYLNGRHWGGFMLAVQHEVLHERSQ